MCNFIKTDGNQCKLSPQRDLCHRHSNSAPVPKKDDVELIDDVEKKVIETDIVPPTPMSPNSSSIITESFEPAL